MDQPKNHHKKRHICEDSEEVLYYFHAIPLPIPIIHPRNREPISIRKTGVSRMSASWSMKDSGYREKSNGSSNNGSIMGPLHDNTLYFQERGVALGDSRARYSSQIFMIEPPGPFTKNRGRETTQTNFMRRADRWI